MLLKTKFMTCVSSLKWQKLTMRRNQGKLIKVGLKIELNLAITFKICYRLFVTISAFTMIQFKVRPHLGSSHEWIICFDYDIEFMNRILAYDVIRDACQLIQ